MIVFKSIQSFFTMLIAWLLVATQSSAPMIDAFPNGRSSSSGVASSRQHKNLVVRAWQVMPHYECATAAVMSGLGDLLAQMQQHRHQFHYHRHRHHEKERRDDATSVTPPTTVFFVMEWKRTVQFMIKGFGEGWLWTVWYRNAERWTLNITQWLVTAFFSGGMTSSGSSSSPFLTTLLATVVALVLDLTVACPFIYSTWDIPVPALLRKTPWRDIPAHVVRKIGPMLRASVKVWTPVNILIYNAPVQYRVYISSFADVFWQSIVSSIVSTTTVVEAGLVAEGG